MAFDPSNYLSKVGNADYLEVKWRLVWLRTDHPDARIETELVSMDEVVQRGQKTPRAIFRAMVSIPGKGSATGYGSETAMDFAEFIEKAETKAIGRALGALGLGTQFCNDFDETDDNGNARIVDSPVRRQLTVAPIQPPQRYDGPQVTNSMPSQPRPMNGGGGGRKYNGPYPVSKHQFAASENQMKFICDLAFQLGLYRDEAPDQLDHDAIGAVIGVDFGGDWPNIAKDHAKAVIDSWKSKRENGESLRHSFERDVADEQSA